MRNLKVTTTLALACALTVLSGCAPESSTPTPTPTILSPTVAPTPTPSLSMDQAQAARVVTNFYEVQNQVASNYEIPLNTFYDVATGELVAERLKTYQQYRGAGYRQVGAIVPEVRSVEGETTPFTVGVCVDISSVDMVDEQGNSVAGGGPTRALHKFTIVAVGTGLRAANDEVVSLEC